MNVPIVRTYPRLLTTGCPRALVCHLLLCVVVPTQSMAVDAETGAEVWRYPTGASILCAPAVADGVVYIGSYDHWFYALDAATGALQWKRNLGGWVCSSPAVANGRVFVGAFDHQLYCLDAATGTTVWTVITGETIWTYMAGDDVRSVPVVVDGVLYFGAADGKVYAFEAGPSNSSPEADAGPGQTVEQSSSGGTEVTLDASGSSDPDGDELTFTWREGGTIIAGPTTDEQVTVTLQLGEHEIELTVEDGDGGSDTDAVVIIVVDTTPPEVTARLDRLCGPPPWSKATWAKFRVVAQAADVCDAAPDTTAVMVAPSVSGYRVRYLRSCVERIVVMRVGRHRTVVLLGKSRAQMEARLAELRDLGGATVTNGQVVTIRKKPAWGAVRAVFAYRCGKLREVVLSAPALRVTAVDDSGNQAMAEAVPDFSRKRRGKRPKR